MEVLKKYIAQFGDIPFDYDNVVLEDKTYYLTSRNAKELSGKISEEFFSIGVPLATNNRSFQASISLLRLIAPHTKNKLVLDSKAAHLFSCGRDIFVDSIKSIGNKEANLFIVCNEKDEVLGLAKKQKEKIAGKTKTVYKNLFDIGIMLRREQKKKR